VPAGGRRTEIGGGALLGGATIRGTASLSGAQIAGGLNLQYADIGAALVCGVADGQRTEIGGHAWLLGVSVGGAVDFRGARIALDLNLRSGKIGGTLSCAPGEGHVTEIVGEITLNSACIAVAELDGRCCADLGALNLVSAQITDLRLVEALPQEVRAHGLHFQELSLPDNADYLDLLAVCKPFEKSTYQFIENWLRNRGEERWARAVYLAMRRRDRRDGRMPYFRRLADWFLDRTVGYGLRSYRLFLYLVAMLVLTTVLFSSPHSVTRAVMVTATEAANAPAAVDQNIFPERWTPLDALWVAVRINIPLVSVGVDSGWVPSSERIPGVPLTYEGFAGIVSLLSWVAVPLFLAGISGILKKEK
jgi:hypothetical protein